MLCTPLILNSSDYAKYISEAIFSLLLLNYFTIFDSRLGGKIIEMELFRDEKDKFRKF